MKRIFPTILLALALPVSAYADMVLRQSTATQAVLIGPFVDDTDGTTAETALTIDAADVRVSKNGANIVGKNSGGCTHDELGFYACTFDATDTDTVGRLQVVVKETGALVVYHVFQVAEEAVYDACCASGAAPLAADGSGFTDIPWNASWDAEVQSEAADALVAYDPPTNAEMEARTLAAASYATAAALATVDSNVDAVLVDTSTTLDGKLNTIDSVAAAIQAKTDQLTFGVTNQLNVNVESMNAEALCGTGDSGTPWTGCP
jgi:hypothetical protein